MFFKLINYDIVDKFANGDILVEFKEDYFEKYDSLYTNLGVFQLMSNKGYLRKIPVDESYITNLVPKNVAIYRNNFGLYEKQLISFLKRDLTEKDINAYINVTLPIIANWGYDFSKKIENHNIR